jgi:hypothetical protein
MTELLLFSFLLTFTDRGKNNNDFVATPCSCFFLTFFATHQVEKNETYVNIRPRNKNSNFSVEQAILNEIT